MSVMSEMQDAATEPRSVSNIAGGAMIVIILALTSVIWYQQGQVKDAIEGLAVIAAKCAKK